MSNRPRSVPRTPLRFEASRLSPAFRLRYDEQAPRPNLRVAELVWESSHDPASQTSWSDLEDDYDELVVVKYAMRYCGVAQIRLASQGLAPKLFFCRRMVQFYSFGWLVVMQAVAQAPRRFISVADQEAVKEDISAAVSLMHAHKLVHGDIRVNNVLCYAPGETYTDKMASAPKRGMLLDFDWAGWEECAKYPMDINMKGVDWPEGVGPGMLIKREHDCQLLQAIDWTALSSDNDKLASDEPSTL